MNQKTSNHKMSVNHLTIPYLAALLILLLSASSITPAQNTKPSTQELWKASKSLKATTTNESVLPQSAAPGTPQSPGPLLAPHPLELLASARTIYVQSHSVYVRRKSIEDALMKKKGFLEMGYAIVKDLSEADLKLEVDHTALTLRYPYSVTHLKTQIVVATGTVHSLRFLNDVPGDTADSFVKQAKAARAATGVPAARH
jgi:hypothetical protein